MWGKDEGSDHGFLNWMLARVGPIEGHSTTERFGRVPVAATVFLEFLDQDAVVAPRQIQNYFRRCSFKLSHRLCDNRFVVQLSHGLWDNSGIRIGWILPVGQLLQYKLRSFG